MLDPNELRIKEQSQQIMERILADVTDRRGWKQEWEQFDLEIQDEIRQRWKELITEVLNHDR